MAALTLFDSVRGNQPQDKPQGHGSQPQLFRTRDSRKGSHPTGKQYKLPHGGSFLGAAHAAIPKSKDAQIDQTTRPSC